MNIRQAMEVEKLRTAKPVFFRTRTMKAPAADVLQRLSIKAKAADEVKKGITSKEFILADIALADIAVIAPYYRSDRVSIMASAEDKPIIVDVNKNKLGGSQCGYCPQVVLLAGADRYNRAKLDGSKTIKAWVGVNAMKRIGSIYADDQFGSQELRDAIDEQLREKFAPKNKDKKDQSFPPMPWIREVYPFENYFVYSFEGQLFRQNYTPNVKKRTVKLSGDPTEVVQKYVNVEASGVKPTKLDYAIDAMGSGPASPASGASSLSEGSGGPNLNLKLSKKKSMKSAVDMSKASPGSGDGPLMKQGPDGKMTRVDKIVTKKKKGMKAKKDKKKVKAFAMRMPSGTNTSMRAPLHPTMPHQRMN